MGVRVKPTTYGPPHASCPHCGRAVAIDGVGLVSHLFVIHAVDPDGTRRGPECAGSRWTPSPDEIFRFPLRGDL